MPKSAKKRKDKAADFSRAKLKLGKGKQIPTNAIDTSFKARSIALPTQSIAVEKDDAVPTTKRRLTFDDLITHIKHHNAGTRKDAILGLRELLEAHLEMINSSLTSLFNACVRVVGDEDASVRKALLSFLSWLLPQISLDHLIPHLPLLLLFTTSAQTHIFPEIRIDAIRFLDLFLDLAPETVTTGWNDADGQHGSRILEGYLGILNAGTKFGETEGPLRATSTASVVLSPASKLIVVKSLSKFLQRAVSFHQPSANQPSNPATSSIPTWYLLSSFLRVEDYDCFDRLLQPTHAFQTSPHRQWNAEVDSQARDEDFVPHFPLIRTHDENRWTLQFLSEAVNPTGTPVNADGSSLADSAFMAHLAHTLHSTLVSIFLDCAPQVFSPSSSPPDTELQLVAAIAEITRSLYGSMLQHSAPQQHDSSVEELKTILGYMSPYFPFGRNLGARDIKLEQTLQDLNIVYCELSSLLVLASRIPLADIRSGRGKARANLRVSQKLEMTLSLQTDRVCEYVSQLLRSEAPSSAQLPRPLTPLAYSALLPTIWSILNSSDQASRNVLHALVEHATKTSSNAATKRLTIEFVARLTLLETETQYRGNFKVRPTDNGKQFEDWVKHLPKVLWELQSNNLSASETILRFLLRLFQRKSCLVHADIMSSIRSRLIPYFLITHAVRGLLPGPYTKLPSSSSVRRLALDVVANLGLLESHDDDLIEAVDRAVVDTGERAYWENLKAVP